MGYWCNWGSLNMAHYFDVISCGLKQTHAQFSLLFGLHSGWYLSVFSESASSCDCPTMNSSFPQPTPSSPCGLQIACSPWWLERKCVLRKEEHPSMLECLLTRTMVWVPPVSTKEEQSRPAWGPSAFQRTALWCSIMPFHVLSLCQQWASRQNLSKTFCYLTTHSAHSVNLVWSTSFISRISSGW